MPSRATEPRQRHTRQAHCPPPNPLSSPSPSTVSSLQSDEERYWQAVGSIDPSTRELCDLLDNVSISSPENKTHETQLARETLVPRTAPAVRAVGPQIPSTPPKSLSRHRSPRITPLSPLPSPLSALSSQPSPYSSAQPRACVQQTSPAMVSSGQLSSSQTRKPKKYYVVTRGREVGVFTSW